MRLEEEQSFHQILSHHKTIRKDKVAVEYRGERVTYAQLNNITNQIAAFLIENFPASGSDLQYIPVLSDRSQSMVYGVLGIMKAGSVFIPLDVDYPDKRIGLMLASVNCRYLIADERFVEKALKIREELGENLKILVLTDGNAKQARTGESGLCYLPLYPQLETDEVSVYNQYLYVYFTSGSTGQPKGILGKHQSLLNFMKWQVSEFGIDDSCRVAQITTPCFDVFLRDVFVPLCSGGTICIPDSTDSILQTPRFVEWIDKAAITHIHVVPTLLRRILNTLKKNPAGPGFRSLRYVISASEVLKGEDLRVFREVFGEEIQLINLYGTTETTLIKSIYYPRREDCDRLLIPIGKPIRGAQLYILNEQLEEIPTEEIGEIFIKTPDMTAGYINNPELNRRNFIPDPFCDNSVELLYRTGDLGKRLEDGNILWLGRKDHQIKIRGIRIELSEIESYLLRRDEIGEVVVTGREINGELCICAYLVSGGELDIEEIRRYLLANLPKNMVPSYIVQIDAIPFLPNNKVDRNNLPDPLLLTRQEGFVPDSPADELEMRFLSIVKEVFHTDNAGMNSDFFTLGGHSLKAVELLTGLHREFDIELTIADIFENTLFSDLSALVRKRKKTKYDFIPSAALQESYPLTAAQQRLFLLSLIDNIDVSYNKPHAFLIEGEFDRNRVEEAFRKIIARYDALRASFHLTEDGPVQKFSENVSFRMDYFELLPATKENADITARDDVWEAIRNFVRPFNLSEAPIFRAGCIRYHENGYVLLWDSHHIICDGISEETINRDFSLLYNNQSLAPSGTEYKNYVTWQYAQETGNTFAEQEKFWLRMFEKAPEPLNLFTDFPRPPRQTYEGDHFRIVMEAEILSGLKEVCRRNNATLFMLLFSAFNVLLSKYSRQQDIVVGLPVSVRNRKEVEDGVGMFVNTLAIRTQLRPEMACNTLLRRLRDCLLETFRNQDYQFEKLIEKLDLQRDLSRNPLFDVMFIMQNMDHAPLTLVGAECRPLVCDRRSSKFDLTLNAEETQGGLVFTFEYARQLYTPGTIERMAAHYLEVLKQFAREPEQPLKNVSLLTGPERQRLAFTYNATDSDYNREALIHQLFEEAADRFPGRTALIFHGQKITYAELNQRSNQLALVLQNRGVAPGTVTGILLTRTPLMLISILAVLKAGGAYLPLDPHFPEKRIHTILDDCECVCVLSQGPLIRQFSPPCQVLDIDGDDLFSGDTGNPTTCVASSDLAYLIYTSGSTGTPKGVMITHRNVVNFIHGISKAIDFSQREKFLCLTTISFDIFVLETLVPLALGKQIVLADENQQLDPLSLCELIADEKIDVVQSTPSRAGMYFHTSRALPFLESVKTFIIGGEPFPSKLLDFLQELPLARFYNVYGPTETTVWSSVKELQGRGRITIGTPIANTTMFVCDETGNLQPAGIPGELCIGGEGVAAGYYRKEELTARQFQSFSVDGKNFSRIYRTGDWVRRLADGELEFVGRKDNQVKIRGFRVELSEVERHLCALTGVEDCICVIKELQEDLPQLIAYYKGSAELELGGIREQLTAELPDYMVPEFIIRLDQFPYTPNNKIDKKALPLPDAERPAPVGVTEEYTDSFEKDIYGIWEKVLNMKNIGMHDNFFHLGGNSFLLIRMHTLLSQKYPGAFSVVDLFAYPTISRLAGFMRKQESSGGEGEDQPTGGLEFPAEYFAWEEEFEPGLLEYILEPVLYTKLRLQAEVYDSTVPCLLMACLVTLLAQISGMSTVPVLVVQEEKEPEVLTFTGNIEAGGEVSKTLVRRITERVSSLKPEESGSLLKLRQLTLRQSVTEILPVFFVSRNGIQGSEETFDLVVRLIKDKIVFDYDTERLNGVMMEELFDQFLDTVFAAADTGIEENKDLHDYGA